MANMKDRKNNLGVVRNVEEIKIVWSVVFNLAFRDGEQTTVSFLLAKHFHEFADHGVLNRARLMAGKSVES